MKLKKVWEPARVEWVIDRFHKDGRVSPYFYAHIFDSKEKAQAFIDERPRCAYRGELKVRLVYRKAGYVYKGTLGYPG